MKQKRENDSSNRVARLNNQEVRARSPYTPQMTTPRLAMRRHAKENYKAGCFRKLRNGLHRLTTASALVSSLKFYKRFGHGRLLAKYSSRSKHHYDK